VKRNKIRNIIIVIVVVTLVGFGGYQVKQARETIRKQELAAENVRVGTYKLQDLKLEPGEYGISGASREPGIVKIDDKEYEFIERGFEVQVGFANQDPKEQIIHKMQINEASTITITGEDSFEVSFWTFKK